MDDTFYDQNRRYNNSPTIPTHLFFFLFTLLAFMGLSWYVNYESVLEGLMNQLKLAMILSPLVLLLVVHFMSSDDGRRSPFVGVLPERDALHRAGGSPWGVGLLLMVLLVMVSYQSEVHQRWFPLLSR
ncbi:hypothetical protein QJS10_CPB12g01516 [Acorus calamus]|uniref:Uncharacterized protein n=1 Tax=Acorus calamus TaxID=4465 RepID=A0AAV9DKH7_ACOCL|nr:hypothetical protein QJS10_CPB12g01516 [Acorus calamus]